MNYNYNSNTGGRQSFGKKVKRVSDVNSMGYNPYDTPNAQPAPTTQPIYPNVNQDMNNFQSGYPAQQPQEFTNVPKVAQNQNFNQPQFQNIQSQLPPNAVPANFAMFNQPIVQDMAVQYGQQLAGAGKTLIKNEVERIVPITKLKYYFSVDTKYVMSKLFLLFFPFTHKDWSVKYEQDGPIQPRFEINAPDLYIPSMAYITYVLVASLVLGMQQRFSPEQIGILSSSALAWCIVELVIYVCTLYIIQIETSLKTLDLLAYSGYKFVGIIASISISLVAGRVGYYVCLVYSSLALAFFLMRNLKMQVLMQPSQNSGYYGASSTPAGRKRKLYFLLFVAGLQPVLSWWLSYHLIASDVTKEAL